MGIASASILDSRVSAALDLKSYEVGRKDHIFLLDVRGCRELKPSGPFESVTVKLEPRGACIVQVRKKAAI